MAQFWKNKRVLVVGGAGFIGSHTVDALVAEGARVSIVDNLSTGLRSNCHPKAQLYVFNAVSPQKMENIFKKEKPEFVMIFSSLVDVPTAIAKPLLASEGIATTINVCEHAVRHKIRKVLYASSGFIYGNTRRIPIKETEPFQPVNPYNIAKATSEYFMQFFSDRYGLPYVALRYAPVYGPRRMIGPIADYIRKISAGKRAEIYGVKTRDYIFVGDVVRANLTAMEKRTSGVSPIFNIGTGREVPLGAVYALVARLLGKPGNTPLQKRSRSSEINRFALDIKKASRMLGFKPQVSLADGLQKTIEWAVDSRF